MLATGPGTPSRPVTVPVDPASLSSLIPGQPVDVLEATGSPGSASVSVILRGATLLGFSRGNSGLLANPSSAVVTIAVPTLEEVEAVVAASRSGSLTLVAADPSDGVGPGSGAPPGPNTVGGSNASGGAGG
jgi:hypothetical protein